MVRYVQPPFDIQTLPMTKKILKYQSQKEFSKNRFEGALINQ